MHITTAISNLDEVVVTGTSAGTIRRQLGSYISTVKQPLYRTRLAKSCSTNMLKQNLQT